MGRRLGEQLLPTCIVERVRRCDDVVGLQALSEYVRKEYQVQTVCGGEGMAQATPGPGVPDHYGSLGVAGAIRKSSSSLALSTQSQQFHVLSEKPSL